MSVLNEETYLDDFLKYEGEANRFSREKETLLSGQNLKIATVVGKVTKVIPTTGTPKGDNTGDGTCTAVTGGVKTQLGTYKATCTKANSDSVVGIFRIEASNGAVLGDMEIAVGHTGTGTFTDPQINLSIAGWVSAYFAIDDYFTIAVIEGSNGLVILDNTAFDGSQDAYGILIKDYDASAADKDCVAIVRDAVIAKSPLKWKITFSGGGTVVPVVGDAIVGLVTTATTARIVEINLTGGAWSTNDAAGNIIVDQLNGDFAAENIAVAGSGTDDATVAATDIAGAFDDLEAAGIITREEA